MIARILHTDIGQGEAVKFEYRTSLSQSNITGILVLLERGKGECSLYQGNRSRAVFRKLDFADGIAAGGLDIKRRRGWFGLNVSANGERVTGTVKGLKISGRTKLTIYLRIDE